MYKSTIMFYWKVSFCYIIIHTDYYIQYCEASIATIDCSLFSRAEGHRLATWRALTYCLSWLCSGKITQICLKEKCKNITYIQVFVCVCVKCTFQAAPPPPPCLPLVSWCASLQPSYRTPPPPPPHPCSRWTDAGRWYSWECGGPSLFI